MPGEVHISGQSEGDRPGLELAPVLSVAGELVANYEQVRIRQLPQDQRRRGQEDLVSLDARILEAVQPA